MSRYELRSMNAKGEVFYERPPELVEAELVEGLPTYKRVFMVIRYTGDEELERYLNGFTNDGWDIHQIMGGLVIFEKWEEVNDEEPEQAGTESGGQEISK